jgi:methionyl-tRNA formyltransferase
MKPLRIVFMGSPDFAVPSLKALQGSPHQIVAVVTGPDKRRGRGKKKSPTVVKKTALNLDLPIIEASDVKSPDFERELIRLRADLFVVVAFRILPPNILKIPEIGSINLHASLLPAYRGAAPIHHAVMNGETETGCTVFFLDEKVDTGNILLQETTGIGPDETTGSVYERLMLMGAEMVVKSVNIISKGDYELQKQDDKLATPAPKIYPKDCRIDFTDNVNKVYNKIRGLSPLPGAWAVLDGQRFRIHKAKPVYPPLSKDGESDEINTNLEQLEPGEIRYNDDIVVAGCAGGMISLMKVQLEGKNIMDATDFFRGYKGLCYLE